MEYGWLRRARRVSRWLVCVALSGCGGTTDDGDGGSVPLEQMPSRLAEVSCHKTFECCTPAEIAARGSGLISYSDEASCRVTLSAFASIGVPQIQESIEKGRVVYDGSALSACLSLVASLPCTSFGTSTRPDCGEFLLPQVEMGGTCESDTECKSGLCDGSSSSPGSCVPMPGLGEDCVFDCAEGSYCADSGVCETPKPNGSPCSANADCESNECSNDVCGDPSMCN